VNKKLLLGVGLGYLLAIVIPPTKLMGKVKGA
jgi:hypothetical protein